MGFLYRLLHSKEIKRYGHIISLGYNCEISFQLFRKNKFLESNLFAWAYIPSLKDTLFTLKNLDLIGSEGFSGPSPLYTCKKTHIGFHGKAGVKMLQENPALKEEDQNELIGRISFLREKFKETAKDGEKNLYIIKVKPEDLDAGDTLKAIYDYLVETVKNDFDFLIIAEKKSSFALPMYKNLYVRFVNFFVPDDNVTTKDNDKKHWQRIFDEFQPQYKLKKTKKYKFEDI